MHPQVRTIPGAQSIPAVLAVGLSREDQRALKTILAALRWNFIAVATQAYGMRHLISGPWPVVICGSTLPDGGWKALLERTRGLPHPPRLIVSSRFADEQMWAEVLNLGGYDVLATPFESAEVRYVLSHAVSSGTLPLKIERETTTADQVI